MRGIGAIAQRMMSEIGAEGYGAHPIFEAQHMECWKDRYLSMASFDDVPLTVRLKRDYDPGLPSLIPEA